MAESTITKRAIAQSLKALTKKKPFDKITIQDISGNCGINRQTFYYHFSDKYDLLKWVYDTELFKPTLGEITVANWNKCLCSMLSAIRKEQYFYVNTISHAENFVASYFVEVTERNLTKAVSEVDAMKAVNPEQQHFFARFFAYGVAGTINEWISKGMPEPPQEIAENMRLLLIFLEKASFTYLMDDGDPDHKPEYPL